MSNVEMSWHTFAAERDLYTALVAARCQRDGLGPIERRLRTVPTSSPAGLTFLVGSDETRSLSICIRGHDLARHLAA